MDTVQWLPLALSLSLALPPLRAISLPPLRTRRHFFLAFLLPDHNEILAANCSRGRCPSGKTLEPGRGGKRAGLLEEEFKRERGMFSVRGWYIFSRHLLSTAIQALFYCFFLKQHPRLVPRNHVFVVHVVCVAAVVRLKEFIFCWKVGYGKWRFLNHFRDRCCFLNAVHLASSTENILGRHAA